MTDLCVRQNRMAWPSGKRNSGDGIRGRTRCVYKRGVKEGRLRYGRAGRTRVCRGEHERDSSDSVTGKNSGVPVPARHGTGCVTVCPAAAGPEWKDTVGRSAKDGETSCRSGTCRGMPCCFGVPKLRHGTARAGRRLSSLASPYLVMQSGLLHRHSAGFGRESRTMECIKGHHGDKQPFLGGSSRKVPLPGHHDQTGGAVKK